MLSLALFLACAPAETDKTDEGTDTTVSDADNDGLTDAEEADLGTDPESADSDGDGFADGDEVTAGTNPAWKWSHTYDQGDYLIGNCPVQPSTETGPSGTGRYDTYTWDTYVEGDVMHNLGEGGWDAFEQEVPVYAFCGNYVLLTQSAEWCGPCQQLASTMAAEQEDIRGQYPNFIFYEYLYQNNRGNEPNANTLSGWSEEFGLDGIPIVSPADNETPEMNWINASGGVPATLLLAPDMTVIWSAADHPGEYYLYDKRSILAAIRAYEASR